ncbi:MAG TPA: HAMP domain-containing sensor histidine kinase [Coriobacteriia bacterium]|nr:HAMP domain-containing sensor histidine kinase [Coriobacteriia bacterium]
MPTDTRNEKPQRPDRPARGTFSRRLSIAFAVVAAFTVAFSAVLISAVWNYQFDQYIRSGLQSASDRVSHVAAEAYSYYGGWTMQTLALIPRSTDQAIAIQIMDQNGSLIYDDSAMSDSTQTTPSPNSQGTQSQGTESPGTQTQGTQSQQAADSNAVRGFTLEPDGPVVTSKILVGSRQVGTVRVWAWGRGALLSERDQQFRRGSFVALTIAALVGVLIASVAGSWYANRLVKPIERITAVARSLRSGDNEARTRLDGEDEIAVLGRTFDEMADAIEADRQLERRLTADVAHELRTPLQAIQATVEAMQDGVLPADEERLGVVRDETVRLARLADGILELTRLERGSLPFEMDRVDLAAPVHAAVDTLAALMESRDLTLAVDVADGVYVNGDADRLQQAISNLLSNAARYTPSGGMITVRVAAEGDQAVTEVSDTGIGISETDLTHVFSRFWRADSARESTTGGLGIGLAVTKEIVDRHKGSIGVDSQLGTGTRFTIRLPRLT